MPLSSAFLLGMLTRVDDARSVLIGIIFTVSFSVWALMMQMGFATVRFDLYYTGLIGNIIMFATSLGAGILLKAKPRDLTDLTIWDKSNDPLV